MLVFDYFRGPDSTGFAALRNNGDVHVAKVASHPIDLFDMKKFEQALAGWSSTVFLGHNRLATKGKVNNTNAHPYLFEKDGGVLVGAHNGTLLKKDWDDLEESLGEKFEVDSMALIAHIAKFGIDKTVPLLTQGKGMSDGSAWALVWFDTSDGTLNFIRNNQRPFWYAYSKEFNKIFWASEYQTIQNALRLSATPYELHTTEEKFSYFATKEDWHYKINIDELKEGALIRPKPRVKELKGKEPAPVKTYQGTTFFPNPNRHNHTTPSTTKLIGSGGSERSETKDNVYPFLVSGTVQQPYGAAVTREEFNALAKYGCSYCTADIEYGDQGIQIFQLKDMILCADCSDMGDTSRVYLGPLGMAG